MVALAVGSAAALPAQYPGHVNTEKKQNTATATLRSIAVLEWSGDRQRPSATRLVPVSLFDGERLQDAGLYLARPVPLALDSGTEYEVESAGVPQGWFDLDGARQIGQDWFGFGKWKPYVPPAPKKPKPSHNQVTVVQNKPADDRPHFKHREETAGGGAASTTAAPDAKGSDAGSAQPQASSEPVDPNRPRLRRRAEEKAAAAEAAANAPETPSSAPDADRPRLVHGKPADLEDQPLPLELTPAALGQTIAVSDADRVGHQSFAYDWISPTDAADAQQQMEGHAARLLGISGAEKTTASKPRAAATQRSAAAGHPRRRATATPAAKPAANPLAEERFHAFALTYGGGATLVLTGQEASSTRSIALIGMEDIYGKVQVLWSSITDDTHLDITPRMTLVDAVDPRGDGRADLLFEQRNATDRRFVLYAVGATSAEQVFATDPLPLHPVATQGD